MLGTGSCASSAKARAAASFIASLIFVARHVERPAENVGEAQHVVYLIGVVGAARRKDDVGTRNDGFVVGVSGSGLASA